MFDFAGFAVRNPAYVTRNARDAWSTRKAMQAYRDAHPACEATGRTDRLNVHHCVPVSIAPHLAGEPLNMIVLHRDVHRWLGHGGDWRSYVPNVRELARAMRVLETRAA